MLLDRVLKLTLNELCDGVRRTLTSVLLLNYLTVAEHFQGRVLGYMVHGGYAS